MKWPFVHRARLEAAEQLADSWHGALIDEQMRSGGLMSEMLRMKRSGYDPVPPRSETPKGLAYRGQELVSRDKLIRQFSEEPGVTPEQAAEAADQVLAELQ